MPLARPRHGRRWQACPRPSRWSIARLYRVNPGEDVIDWPLVMAASTITILPVLLGFVLVERHLVRGITMGAVK